MRWDEVDMERKLWTIPAHRMKAGREETALAHVIGDKPEQAYRRGDALEKRRKLMEAWAIASRAPAQRC
jgi:hypothetical protein